jgi:hypothetical protein
MAKPLLLPAQHGGTKWLGMREKRGVVDAGFIAVTSGFLQP